MYQIKCIQSGDVIEENLKSTGVHDGMGVERWLGWSPPSFIQIESKLPKFVFGVVSGWVGWLGWAKHTPRYVAY